MRLELQILRLSGEQFDSCNVGDDGRMAMEVAWPVTLPPLAKIVVRFKEQLGRGIHQSTAHMMRAGLDIVSIFKYVLGHNPCYLTADT